MTKQRKGRRANQSEPFDYQASSKKFDTEADAQAYMAKRRAELGGKRRLELKPRSSARFLVRIPQEEFSKLSDPNGTVNAQFIDLADIPPGYESGRSAPGYKGPTFESEYAKAALLKQKDWAPTLEVPVRSLLSKTGELQPAALIDLGGRLGVAEQSMLRELTVDEIPGAVGEITARSKHASKSRKPPDESKSRYGQARSTTPQ